MSEAQVSTMETVNSDHVRPIRIWMADLTYTQQGTPAETIPYGIGCVASYVQDRFGFDTPIRLFRYPEKLIEALESDELPDIMAFGSFIWNAALQLEFARRIKEIAPHVIIVFGGAEFPLVETERHAYLRHHDVIDFFVNGEGEIPFGELIETLGASGMNRDMAHGKVGGVFSIAPDGIYHTGGPVTRIRDLGEMPSPYLTGVLDEFFDGRLIPILQTNRGCPFKCTFCGVGPDHHNKVVRHTPERVTAELEYMARMMEDQRGKGGRNDLYIADSNFGMYKQDIPTAHEIARMRREHNWPDFALVSSGKNQKDRVVEVARIVGGAIRIGGSVQSLDPDVLANIKRSNISEEMLMNLPFESRNADGVVYAETILGLPGDSKEKHFATLKVLVEAGFNLIIAHQLRMTKGAELGNVAEQVKFGMKKMFRAYPQCMGRYVLNGRDLDAAEIEEICVGNDLFDFDDYLECRKRHLIIHLFLNHSMYETVPTLLRELSISVYRWVEVLSNLPLSGPLKAFFDEYEATIRSELWDNEADLREFLRQDGVIEKFQRGELGFNVLWTYKAKGLVNHPRELGDLARRSMTQVLLENGMDVDTYMPFIDDALTFHTCRLENLFHDREQVPEAMIQFDIEKFLQQHDSPEPDDYRFNSPVPHRFVFTGEQQEVFNRYTEIYDVSNHGLGRMMAKVFTNKILRQPVAISN